MVSAKAEYMQAKGKMGGDHAELQVLLYYKHIFGRV